eukprot:NODE_29_length_33183_cov_0.333666.p7 type:complete len:327 gc:universal NODE_29_length_33183_cov_0.333666:8413-9393(+)
MENQDGNSSHDNVFKPSVQMDSQVVKGPDFEDDSFDLLNCFKSIGFQATNLGLAMDIIDTMQMEDATIFLGYTSNMVTSGLRDVFKFLVKNKKVKCIVTTAGGIEEDLIKCLAPTYIGDFNLPGKQLRNQGLNRAGNLVIPNNNYCLFEKWLYPILDEMIISQKEGKIWSPSSVINHLGKLINNEDSIYYWAYKNNIPVYCPALTDGSLGDMIYFHSFRNEGLIIDIVQDIRSLNTIAVKAEKTGMIILGGGVIKHHICNANLMRNGADYAVYLNTSNEYDGSDSGASTEEAISWGKISSNAQHVKVVGDATILFPIVVAKCFVNK